MNSAAKDDRGHEPLYVTLTAQVRSFATRRDESAGCPAHSFVLKKALAGRSLDPRRKGPKSTWSQLRTYMILHRSLSVLHCSVSVASPRMGSPG
jgi:hypothetical protein